MKIRIGKRNIKTAIAVFLSVLISKILKLEYPFFTVIAAIFSMENSVANSYKAGLYRLIGTLTGAAVGVLFVYIQPGNALLMGFGTILLILICSTFKWDRAIPIAGVMFAAVMLSINNKNPIQYSFSRVLDTFAGIVIAVAVNYFIFPPHNLSQMRSRLNTINDEITKAVRELFCSGKSSDIKGLTEIIDFIKFLDVYSAEFEHKTNDAEFKNIGNELELLRDILSHLKMVNEIFAECSLDHDNIDKLMALGFCLTNADNPRSSNENIVFNYHTGKVLDMLLMFRTESA